MRRNKWRCIDQRSRELIRHSSRAIIVGAILPFLALLANPATALRYQLSARIIAAPAASLGGFDRLAVDNTPVGPASRPAASRAAATNV